MPALSCLPLSQVLRTYFITAISSSPFLLGTSTTILRRMLEKRNPVLRSLLWHTFYLQFCMGSTRAEIDKACLELRAQGYSGVILEYALEVLKDAEGNEAEDVKVWRKGMLDTVHMAQPGDFVGLKWSGMGVAAMRRMKDDLEPTERMSEAMHALCTAAKEKNVSLLPAAEETWSLNGFHNWCLKMQRVYNLSGKSVVYATYQAYLKQTPRTVAKHLEVAKEEGFTLGLKLVRGAYLGSEKRELIHPSIEATHEAYDGIAEALLKREPNSWVPSPAASKAWPKTNIMLATHNAISVARAQALRRTQAASNIPLTPLAFAQLQGMADEVSCALVAAAKAAESEEGAVKERVYKCGTWGTMDECLNYLLRRAAENKDAAGRTRETRMAMGAEIGRRVRGLVGLA
ncbi:proline dehydrogenase [Recurvomyces mirabilis]|nr:proline dehydrogenase [Recurvomyces mirabilis]